MLIGTFETTFESWKVSSVWRCLVRMTRLLLFIMDLEKAVLALPFNCRN